MDAKTATVGVVLFIFFSNISIIGSAIVYVILKPVSSENATTAELSCRFTVDDGGYSFSGLTWGKITPKYIIPIVSFTAGSMQYASGYSPPQYTATKTDFESKLTISSVKHEDAGIYVCQVNFRNSSGNELHKAAVSELTVYVPPRALIITHNGISYGNGASIPVLAENNRKFTCTANGITPAATFEWSGSSTNMSVGARTQTDTTTTTSILISSTSAITLDILENPETLNLECQAYNTHDRSNGASIAVTIAVKVPPKAVKLSDANGDKTNGVSVAVYEGTPHEFTCIVLGTRPAATIQWFIDSVLQSAGVGTLTWTSNNLHDTTGNLTFTPSRADHMKELTCQAYIVESWLYPTSYVLLDVYGPPNTPIISDVTSPMTEGISVRLTCEADMGYPDDWRLDWTRGNPPVTIQGTTTTPSAFDNRYRFTSVLYFTPDRADNGDRVTCTANRETDVIGPAGSTNVLNVQFGARIINKEDNSTVFQHGEDGVIICIVDGNPMPTVRWYFQDSPTTPIDTTTPGYNVMNEPATREGIHGIGVRSNLTVQNVDFPTDYGIYTCTASNVIGVEDSLNIDVTGLTLTITHNTTSYSHGASFPVLSGNGSQFTCTANGITPSATFMWALSEGGSSLPVGTPNQTDSLTSTITVNIPENPETLNLECEAHYNTPGSNHRSHIGVTLQVKVPPKAVKLSDANGDKTNGVTVAVYEGTPHDFTCMVQGTRPAATIQWFIGNDRQLFGVSTSTNTSNNLYDTTGNLTFTPSRADHRKELTCQAGIAESRWPYPASGVLLDVYVPPRALTITHNTTSYSNGASIPVLSGNGSQFACTANGITPSATFVWSLSDGDTNLPVGTQNQTNTLTNPPLLDSTSTITVDISENPETLTLECEAYNTLDGSNGASIAVTLQVRVPPKAVKLSDANGDETNGVTVAVYEGTPHNFTCVVQDTRPAATIRWFVGNDRQLFGVSTSTNTSNNLYDTTGNLTFTPSRADHRKELTCEAYISESRWPYPASGVLLDVYVPTPVQEFVEVPNKNGTEQQSRFAVRCTIENAVTYDWYKIGAEGSRVFITSGYTLIFPGFQDVQDQGTYVCVGRGRDNTTKEHETLVVRSGASTLLASMTMPHEVFTANLSDLSSDAATRLKTRIHNVLLNDAMNDFRSVHSSGISWEVVRFSPGSVILDMAVVVTPDNPATNRTSDEDLKVSLMTIMSNHIGNDTASSEMFDSGTLHVVSLSSCPQSVWTIEGANVTFPETRVKQKVELLRWKCTSESKEGTMSISRACVGDFVGAAYWLNPEASSCITDIAQQLEALSNVTVTRDNVDKVAQSLESLTSDPSAVDGRVVSLVASTLGNIVAVRDPSPEVTSSVVSIVDNLLQVDSGAFNASQNAASTSRIVKALESQISYVLQDGANFTQVATSLAVQAVNAPYSSLTHGITFAANNKDNLTLTEEQVDVHYNAVSTELVQTSIALPDALMEQLPTESAPAGISFILYQNSKLFPSMTIKKSHRLVEGAVISASVLGVHLRDLPEESPVVGTFRRSKGRGGQPSICVFWDTKLNDGIGDWSQQGCHRVALDTDGWTVCHCNHTTSFAVLVDIYGKASSSLALDIASKIGCGISVVALLLTIIIYMSIKSLRSKTPGRILVCLSASLLCLYLVFLVGIEQTSSRVVCIIVAALLHYFTLTTVAWMGAEATNIYVKLVRLSTVGIRHFMIKASLVAWGFPMLVVGVIMAVDHTVYQNEISCFMKPGAAFYYGQLLVMGLVLLYNAVIFLLVTHQLTCKRRKIQRSSSRKGKQENVRRLQNISSIAVLLGLTWAFGVLSILESSTLVFQILFSIFNSLQGLFIFLLFVVRQEKIRVMIGGKLLRTVSRGQSELTTESSINASCSKSISIKDKDNNIALTQSKKGLVVNEEMKK